ncbi:MAG: hypothetical protein AMXMBFR58_26830 [Phycisphaerae bacterium]
MVTRTAVWLLLVFVPAAALNGSVVAYTNAGGQFTWDTGEYYDSLGEFPGNFLDITQPASQLGARKNGAFGKWWVANIALHDPAPSYMRGEPGAEVAQITDPKLFDWNGGTNNFIAYSLREYGPGERIRSDARWRENAIYFIHLPNSMSLSEGTPCISDLAYVGVRTRIAGQWHYGWILIADHDVPLAWAYETEPNTPIDIPIPAPSAGLIFLAAAGVLAPRRSRDSLLSIDRTANAL